MLVATHAVAGGIAGEQIGNPVLAFLVGIVFHFIIDAIPHFDTTDDHLLTFRQCAYIIGDFILGILIIIFVMRIDLSLKSPFLWGAFGSVLPDVFDNFPVIKDWFRRNSAGKRVHFLHNKIQQVKIAPLLGFFIQYGLLTLLVIYYLAKK